MGTRSLTVFKEDDLMDIKHGKLHKGREIACLYRQMDGYPDGHGQELADLLEGYVVGNGIGSDSPPKYANGMGCLAAQIIGLLKWDRDLEAIKHFSTALQTPAGSFYLYPPGTRDVGEEYIYTVYHVAGVVHVKVEECLYKKRKRPVLFDGPVETYEGEKVAAARARS